MVVPETKALFSIGNTEESKKMRSRKKRRIKLIWDINMGTGRLKRKKTKVGERKMSRRRRRRSGRGEEEQYEIYKMFC